MSWGQRMPDGKICIEFAEANFITVNNNDIVVQLKKALIQTDYLNPEKSLLKTNPPLEWYAIMSTDGHYHQFHSELGSGKIIKEIFMRANMCWYIISSCVDADFNTVIFDSPDGIILDSLKNL